MSRRKPPPTPQDLERLERTVLVVCDEDPKGRVNKIQTFVRGDSWEPQFQQFVELYEGQVKHVLACKFCKQTVTIHAEKLEPILGILNDRGIRKISLRNLAFAIKQTYRPGSQVAL